MDNTDYIIDKNGDIQPNFEIHKNTISMLEFYNFIVRESKIKKNK